MINKRRLTLDNFINKAITIYGTKYNYDSVIFINSLTKVNIKCNLCNKIIITTPSEHIYSNRQCPCVSENKRKKQFEKEFYIKANKVHNNKYDYSLVIYNNALTKVKIICKKCNNIFEQTPGDHVWGSGCPICKFSKGEEECFKILKTIKTVNEILPQFKFIDCINIKPLPFDFKVKLCNDIYFLIEYQGKQHYTSESWFSENLEDIQKRDKIKFDYCKDNNINLLIIKYTEFKNIDNIINDYISKLI